MINHGKLELIIGSMFSGKSTELIRQISRNKIAGRKVMTISHCSDDRYGKELISTHCGSNIIPDYMLSSLKSVPEYDQYIYSADVIFIEEGQFFSDIVDFCKKSVDIDKKFVVVSALDGDFQREPFPQISRLYPLADKITKLNAICLRCSNIGIQNDASFSLRTVNSMDKHLVGGKDSYEAVCRYHYLDGIEMRNC